KKRLSEVVAGFAEPDAGEPEAAAEVADAAAEAADGDEDEDDDAASEEEEAGPTGPDPAEVKARMDALRALYAKFQKQHEKYGSEDKKVVKTRQQMAEAFLSFKLPVPMVDNFVRKLREVVTAIRTHERVIMDLCVKHARMPRKDFLRTFPGNETNLNWAD